MAGNSRNAELTEKETSGKGHDKYIVPTQVSQFEPSIPRPSTVGLNELRNPELVPVSVSIQRRADADLRLFSVIDVDALCNRPIEHDRSKCDPEEVEKSTQYGESIGVPKSSTAGRVRNECNTEIRFDQTDRVRCVGSARCVGDEHYDSETVRLLMGIMKQCGYKDKRKKKRRCGSSGTM